MCYELLNELKALSVTISSIISLWQTLKIYVMNLIELNLTEKIRKYKLALLNERL